MSEFSHFKQNTLYIWTYLKIIRNTIYSNFSTYLQDNTRSHRRRRVRTGRALLRASMRGTALRMLGVPHIGHRHHPRWRPRRAVQVRVAKSRTSGECGDVRSEGHPVFGGARSRHHSLLDGGRHREERQGVREAGGPTHIWKQRIRVSFIFFFIWWD